MKLTIELKGMDKLSATLQALGDRAPKALGRALWREGTAIMTDARAITPVDTGVLRNSGLVNLPVVSNGKVEVTLGFGGAASAYAEVQHEEVTYYHTPPTQYKYLEQPLLQAARMMEQRLAATLLAEMK